MRAKPCLFIVGVFLLASGCGNGGAGPKDVAVTDTAINDSTEPVADLPAEGDDAPVDDAVLSDASPSDVFPQDSTDAAEVQSEPSLQPPDLWLDPFTVLVEADRTLVPPNAPVTFEARIGRGTPDGAVTFTWDLGKGIADPDDKEGAAVQHLRFLDSGEHVVTVTAMDASMTRITATAIVRVVSGGPYTVGDIDGDGLVEAEDAALVDLQLAGGALVKAARFSQADVDQDGALSPRDALLIREAALAGAPAPRFLDPAAGAPGRKLFLIHPALLDVGALVRVTVGQSEPQVPFRWVPGYAVFVVPPDAGPEGAVSLSVEVDGAVVDIFDFELLPLPKPSSPPGSKLTNALVDVRKLLEELPPLMDEYFDAAEVPQDQRAVVKALLSVASDAYSSHVAALVNALNMMEEEGRAGFEQIALANGLDQIVADIASVRNEIDSGRNGGVLKVLCLAHRIADISAKVAEVCDLAAGFVDWFDWWPLNTLPVVGQVIHFLNSLTNILGGVTDIIGLAAEFIPDFGEIKAKATPAELMTGQSTHVSASVRLEIASKLCAEAAEAVVGTLMEKMNELLTTRLVKAIPFLGKAADKKKKAGPLFDTVVKLVTKVISTLVGKLLDAVGVQNLIVSLAQSVCSLLPDPYLGVTPIALEASCGVGAGDAWTCTEDCAGTVTLQAVADVCGEEKKGGEAKVECTICPADCDKEGELLCRNDEVYICTSLSDSPPCLAFKFLEACGNAPPCVEGKCPVACGPGTCDGCCDPQGQCKEGTTNEQCGKGGAPCAPCIAPSACVANACSCVPNCGGKMCGSDGCGGSCGTCNPGQTCNSGICASTQQCEPPSYWSAEVGTCIWKEGEICYIPYPTCPIDWKQCPKVGGASGCGLCPDPGDAVEIAKDCGVTPLCSVCVCYHCIL